MTVHSLVRCRLIPRNRFLGIPSSGIQRFLGLFGHILKIEIPLDLFLAQLDAGFYVTGVHDLCDSLIVMLAGILVVTGMRDEVFIRGQQLGDDILVLSTRAQRASGRRE